MNENETQGILQDLTGSKAVQDLKLNARNTINEVKGSASKATGIAPKAKQPIVENAVFERMQKLAGIIQEN